MSRSKDREYRKWRIKVIRRDKKCILCGSRYRRAAHHVNTWHYFPKERYDVKNGVCLCGHCHMMYHTKFKSSYRCKGTKKDFIRFAKLATYFRES